MNEHYIELVKITYDRTITVRVDGHETTYTMSEGDTLVVDDKGRMSVRHPPRPGRHQVAVVRGDGVVVQVDGGPLKAMQAGDTLALTETVRLSQ